MDMNERQIELEFQRQVRLCIGIGKTRMLEIVNASFAVDRSHVWQFSNDGADCMRCGIKFLLGVDKKCNGSNS